MHDSAFALGKSFFATYWRAEYVSVLDIGSMNVNGSLRDCAPQSAKFVGVDLAAGPGVDIVVQGGAALPFPDEQFDVVVSTCCFEHDTAFWVTFLEMMRVLKSGGYAYINAPSNGEYHSYPLDCWRFYPDAGIALERWAHYSKQPVILIESFIAGRMRDQWNDFVMVFRKGSGAAVPARFLSDVVQPTYNVRRIGQSKLINLCKKTEDQLIMARQSPVEAAAPAAGAGMPGLNISAKW